MTLVKLDTPENLTEPMLGSEISRKEFKKGTYNASFDTDIMQDSTQIFWWKCSHNLWNAKEPNPLPSPRQRRLWRGEWRKGRNSLHTKFSIDGGPCQVVWVLFTSNLSVLPAWKEFFSGRLRSFGRSIYSISLGQGLSCRQSQFLRISGSIRSSKMRVGLLNSVS